MEHSCKFLGKFLIELVQIGHSAGSLITEVISLFKTFQKLTATTTFTVHFSKECLKMFSWANNLIQVILSNFYMKKFSEIEQLYLYNYVFPFFLITFIISLTSSYRYYIHLLISLIFCVFGFSIGYIQTNTNILKIYGSIAFAIIIIVIIILWRIEDVSMYLYGDGQHSESRITFTFSLFNTILITAVMLTPFLIRSTYFIGSLMFITEIIISISLLVEFFIGNYIRNIELELDENEDKRKKHKFIYKYVYKYECIYSDDYLYSDDEYILEYKFKYNVYFIPYIFTFVNNFFSLLIIPCTEHFVNLIKSGLNLKYNWQIVVGYVIIGLILPILMTLFLIILEYSDYKIKYKEDKKFYIFFELIDVIRQIAYSIVAAYDIPIACICIEAAWILALLIIRPYKNLSDYFLQGGNSLIVIINNAVAIVCKYKKTGFLSFEWCLVLLIVTCLPAIASLYVYFAVDFKYEEVDDNSSSSENDDRIISSKNDDNSGSSERNDRIIYSQSDDNYGSNERNDNDNSCKSDDNYGSNERNDNDNSCKSDDNYGSNERNDNDNSCKSDDNSGSNERNDNGNSRKSDDNSGSDERNDNGNSCKKYDDILDGKNDITYNLSVLLKLAMPFAYLFFGMFFAAFYSYISNNVFKNNYP